MTRFWTIYFTIVILWIFTILLTSCSVEPKVDPVIQVIPESVLDAQEFCANLPEGEWVLVRKL